MANKKEEIKYEDMIGRLSEDEIVWPKLDVNGNKYERPVSTVKITSNLFACISGRITDEHQQTVFKLREFVKTLPAKKVTNEAK